VITRTTPTSWPEVRHQVAIRRATVLAWWRGAKGEVITLFVFVWLVAATAFASFADRRDWETSAIAPLALGGVIAGAAIVAQAGYLLRPLRDPLGGRAVSTGEISIRPATPADSEAILATIDDVVASANGWDDNVLQVVRKEIRSGGHRGEYVIEDHTGLVVGTIRLDYLSPGPHQPAIGLWLGERGRGRGLATKALLAILVLAAEAGLERCYLGTDADNIAMRRAALAAGGDAISTHPHLLPNGATVSSVWFELLAPKH